MWHNPNKAATPSADNLAVLIPYSQGIWIYSKSDGEPLRYAMNSPHSRTSSEVVDFVSQLPEPRLATWLGSGPCTLLGQLLEREPAHLLRGQLLDRLRERDEPLPGRHLR